MSPVLRIALIIGAVLALALVVRRVRQERIRISDSVFWVTAATLLVALALFPQLAFLFSGLLGFLSPSNFVFVVIIALMLVKLFNLSCDVSRLTDKVERLARDQALADAERDQGKDPRS